MGFAISVFMVDDSGFRTSGFGFRVSGSGVWPSGWGVGFQRLGVSPHTHASSEGVSDFGFRISHFESTVQGS